jgi:hypothetical protein
MKDVIISLIIIVVTAALIAALFAVKAAQSRAQRLAIQAYCAAHGLTYTEVAERLKSAFVIRGDGWLLESATVMAERGSESGSMDAALSTRWQSDTDAPCTHSLHLGTALGPLNPPSGLALATLAAAVFSPADGATSPVSLGPVLDARFVLLAQPGATASLLGTEVPLILAAWPEGWPLTVAVKPHGIRIELQGKRLKTAQELDTLITLGLALRAQMQATATVDDAHDEKEDAL